MMHNAPPIITLFFSVTVPTIGFLFVKQLIEGGWQEREVCECGHHEQWRMGSSDRVCKG